MVRIYWFALVLFLLSSCGDSAESNNNSTVPAMSKEEAMQAGQRLFMSNCKVCHSLDKTAPSGMAPVLESIKTHWPDRNILARYIKNAPEMMQADDRSRKIYQEWKTKAQMPPFNGLSSQEIDNIILFLYNNT